MLTKIRFRKIIVQFITVKNIIMFPTKDICQKITFPT